MAHKVTLRKRPKEILDGLSQVDKEAHRLITRAIKMVGDNPEDPKPYKASPSPYPGYNDQENIFKIWVGAYGVHYQVDNAEKKVIVLRIGLPMLLHKAARKALQSGETKKK